MSWVDVVGRDPVPWLLDPGNPSARTLTLKHIFGKSPTELEPEQDRILAWSPIASLRRHWVPTNYWGRAANPYYGGPVGNFGTLFLLAQVGAPRFDEIAPVCENLLDRGTLPNGVFAPTGQTAAPWPATTGMALTVLTHFGYDDDVRTQRAWQVLEDVIHASPDTLGIPSVQRGGVAAAAKVLSALLHRGGDEPRKDDAETIGIVCRYLLAHEYDLDGRESDWLQPRFPRIYETDVVELAHLLAHTAHRDHPVSRGLSESMLALKDASGRWIKTKTTPALFHERINQPSRWLTFEAIHALMLLHGDEIYAA